MDTQCKVKILSHFAEDKEIISAVITQFIESYPSYLSEIRRAIECQESKEIEVQAHTLKGVISNFFWDPLIDLSLALEESGKEADFSQAEKLLRDLEEALEELVGNLTKFSQEELTTL